MKKINKNTIWWIVGLLIFFSIVAITYFSFTIRMIGLWIMIAFGLIGGTTIIYSFVSVFTKKFYLRCLVTSIIAALCILGYLKYKEGPTVIQMKEDVLYVHPKSEVIKDIYDGSKNDPNLRQDSVK